MDYQDLFASFLAAHAKAQTGDKEAVSKAQHLSQEILEAMQVYNLHETQLNDESKQLFEQCWVAYRRKGSKKKALEQWKKIKKEMNILAHIEAYVGSRDICYQKDFERYLRDETFLEIIVKGQDIIYDPAHPDTFAEPVTENKTLEYNGVIYR